MSDANVKEIMLRFDSMKAVRSEWESLWQDIKDYVRPNTSDFHQVNERGESQVDKIYDSTALWALEQLAAGLNSYLTSPTSRWFTLRLMERDQLTEEELLYLEYVSDAVYYEYNKPTVGFAPAIHEAYMDLGAFGTCSLFQDWSDTHRSIRFCSEPLMSCYVDENADGIIDTIAREMKMTALQVRDKFDADTPDEILVDIDKKQFQKEYNILHIVYPRRDRDVMKLGAKGKPFASVWIWKDKQMLIREGGFDSFPYHVGRWTKISGDQYGRSPSMTCMPAIKMVNAMNKTIIKAGQKIVDPPLVLPSDGYMLPLRTAPGSLVFKEPGVENIVPLETRGRVDIGLDLINAHRDQILKAFFVDWIIRDKKRERQTTTEIVDDREEILRQMAPMLGRIQNEMLGPIIKRTLDIMARKNKLPPPPPSLEGSTLDITYISPAAMAQFGGKAIGIQRFIQDIGQLASVMPQVMDIVDADMVASELARYRDVSRRVLRDQQSVAQLRQERAQQQQMAMQLQAGTQVASALKDASVAQRNFNQG